MVVALAFDWIWCGLLHINQSFFLIQTQLQLKGPLLVDGTVSFAVRAAFNKGWREKKAFRAQFQEGDVLEVQYLNH